MTHLDKYYAFLNRELVTLSKKIKEAHLKKDFKQAREIGDKIYEIGFEFHHTLSLELHSLERFINENPESEKSLRSYHESLSEKKEDLTHSLNKYLDSILKV
jgi:hypothetical protein